jgi:hypothetical protein
MQGLLVETRADLALPYGGAAWLAPFAHKEVPGAEAELLLFVRVKIHLCDFGQIEPTPLDIDIAKVRPGAESCLGGWRQHLAELYLANVTHPNDTPTGRK